MTEPKPAEPIAYDLPVRFLQPPETGPIEEAVAYVNHRWFQQLIPIQTECYRCHATSPIVHINHGTLAFGNPRLLRKASHPTRSSGTYKDRDITNETKKAFADVGWKFQLRRSYCPRCKDLGSA
jgi:hypothetical protein